MPGKGKKIFRRTLAEHIENDLNGGDVIVFRSLQGLVDFFHRDSEMGDFPFPFKVFKEAEYLRTGIYLPGGAVKLNQIQPVQTGSFQAPFHIGSECFRCIAFRHMGSDLTTAFCCHVNPLASGFDNTADGLFAFSVGINIRGVDKIDSPVDGGIDYFFGVGIVKSTAPFSPHLPGTQGNLCNAETGFTKSSSVHFFLLF